MTAQVFAQLVKGKRVGKGRWLALCPVHGDRNNPSLSIRDGKKTLLLYCWSGCTPTSILSSVGLTWRDVMGDQIMTPEIRQRLTNESRLRLLTTRWGALQILKVTDFDNRHYWSAAEQKTDAEIEALRGKIDPLLSREQKMKAAIEQHGWDRIWELFLLTPKGKSQSALYSIDSAPWIPQKN